MNCANLPSQLIKDLTIVLGPIASNLESGCGFTSVLLFLLAKDLNLDPKLNECIVNNFGHYVVSIDQIYYDFAFKQFESESDFPYSSETQTYSNIRTLTEAESMDVVKTFAYNDARSDLLRELYIELRRLLIAKYAECSEHNLF